MTFDAEKKHSYGLIKSNKSNNATSTNVHEYECNCSVSVRTVHFVHVHPGSGVDADVFSGHGADPHIPDHRQLTGDAED